MHLLLEFRHIENGTFADLKSLTSLGLHFNKINIIEPDGFKDLNQLTILTLADNLLTNIDFPTLQNMNSLSHLDLANNMITHIHSGTFQDNKNLEILYLMSNCITEINTNAFKNLNSLLVLELNNNGIYSIALDSLSHMKDLLVLVLNNNTLTTPKNFSHVFQSVKTAYFHNNCWDFTPDGVQDMEPMRQWYQTTLGSAPEPSFVCQNQDSQLCCFITGKDDFNHCKPVCFAPPSRCHGLPSKAADTTTTIAIAVSTSIVTLAGLSVSYLTCRFFKGSEGEERGCLSFTHQPLPGQDIESHVVGSEGKPANALSLADSNIDHQTIED